MNLFKRETGSSGRQLLRTSFVMQEKFRRVSQAQAAGLGPARGVGSSSPHWIGSNPLNQNLISSSPLCDCVDGLCYAGVHAPVRSEAYLPSSFRASEARHRFCGLAWTRSPEKTGSPEARRHLLRCAPVHPSRTSSAPETVPYISMVLPQRIPALLPFCSPLGAIRSFCESSSPPPVSIRNTSSSPRLLHSRVNPRACLISIISWLGMVGESGKPGSLNSILAVAQINMRGRLSLFDMH